MRFSSAPSSAPDCSGATYFNDAVLTPVAIKATAGQIYLLDVVNSAAATSYLQVFFLPQAKVTLGTTVPDFVVKIPTNATNPSKTIAFTVPIGGRNLAGTPGTGLTIAGTTTWNGSTTVALGVTAVYS